MLDMLQAGQLDLVIHNVSATTTRDNVEQRIMFSEELVVVASLTSDLAGRSSISLEEVANRRVVAFRRGAAFRDIADQAFARLGLSPRIALESSDLVTIRSLVAEGLGISLMPRSLAETPGKPITQLTVKPEGLTRSVSLAWRSDHPGSPAAGALLDHLHRWLDERHQPAAPTNTNRQQPGLIRPDHPVPER
jgi:DNA-binding transcriptional LysR family regulator